ncbi:MAG: exodeoxyribonuclease V subunit gamma, partial [Spirochaetaceae bacterium]|nr:exodeoxyribonuclease V subunit gamma [Spirochaetaceae bacterium]
EIISIDLSRRTSDKYSFLEVFLSAGEKVYFFYTGRNNIDNEVLQPSPLITELGEYLDANFKCEDGSSYYKSIVENEKLQSFDKEYFSIDSKLFSYNERDFRLAESYYINEKLSSRKIDFEPLSIEVEDSVLEITVRDLLQFLKNPVKFFFNHSCRIYMDELELREEDSNENIELDRFEKYSFFEDLVLSSHIDSETIQSIDEKVEEFCLLQSRRGEMIDSELSIPDADRLSDVARQIVDNIKSHTLLSSRPQPVSFTFGDAQDLKKSILKSPKIKLPGSVEVKIVGSLPPLYFYPDRTVSYIDYTGSSKPSSRNWILPFLMSRLLPSEIVGEKGIQALLVSPKDVHSVQFPVGEETGLSNMIGSYVGNLEKPLPLYPEIAELLNDKKNPGKEWKSEDFTALFYNKWMEKGESENFGYSEFKECSYRAKVYKGLPDFNRDQMKDLFESVYREIFMALNEGGGSE